MKKIYEIVSEIEKVAFKIRGIELKAGRFTLLNMAKLERDGVTQESFAIRPVELITQVIFDLLDTDSKAQFNNDLEVFRSCLSLNDFKELSEVFEQIYNDALPVVKNEETAPQ